MVFLVHGTMGGFSIETEHFRYYIMELWILFNSSVLSGSWYSSDSGREWHLLVIARGEISNSPLIPGRESSLLRLDESENSTLSSPLLIPPGWWARVTCYWSPYGFLNTTGGAKTPLLSLGSGENTELPQDSPDTTVVVSLLGRDTLLPVYSWV